MPLLPRPAPGSPEVSEGEPAAAGIEPGPLETAEDRRGQRDDVIRSVMAMLARDARAEGIPEEELAGYGLPEKEREDGSLKLFRLLAGHYRYSISNAVALKNEAGAQLVDLPHINAGYIFVARGVRVLAPKGCKLQIYENHNVPIDFREVITNVQEFSGEVPGQCLFRGPCKPQAVVLGCEEAGQIMLRLEGDLVPEEYLPRV
jgi:hypothetical protein